MKRWLCMLLLPFLLVGCYGEPSMGEQVVVTGLGIAERDGVWTLSVQVVEALRIAGSLSEQSEPATAVYTASGRSVAEALQAFLNETGKRTYILQNQIIVLEEQTCHAVSLTQVLDYFIRNQEGRSTVDLVVSRGDPAALLSIVGGSDAIPAEYLSQMLEEARRWSQCVKARLLDAERASSGMYDVALPILQVIKDTPHLAGTALFRNGKQTDTLNQRETVGLILASGESKRCLYTLGNNAFRLEELSSTVTVQPDKEGWQYHIAVSAATRTVEMTDDTAPSLSEVENAVAADIYAALTHAVNDCGCDPLGLARLTAVRYCGSGVTQVSAAQALPRATFSVDVRLSQTDSGFVTES